MHGSFLPFLMLNKQCPSCTSSSSSSISSRLPQPSPLPPPPPSPPSAPPASSFSCNLCMGSSQDMSLTGTCHSIILGCMHALSCVKINALNCFPDSVSYTRYAFRQFQNNLPRKLFVLRDCMCMLNCFCFMQFKLS